MLREAEVRPSQGENTGAICRGLGISEQSNYRWRREGLKVPHRQPKRGRLWLNDGPCIRLRPIHRGRVWSYDFVADRTHDGKAFRMLTVIDEFSRECLAIHVRSDDVLMVLAELFAHHGPLDHIRSDNCAEFTRIAVRKWLGRIGVKTLYIEPVSPWENGYCGSFNGKLREELLNGEIFYTLKKAQILIEGWRRHYNTVRPHSSLGYVPPAPRNHLALRRRPVLRFNTVSPSRRSEPPEL